MPFQILTFSFLCLCSRCLQSEFSADRINIPPWPSASLSCRGRGVKARWCFPGGVCDGGSRVGCYEPRLCLSGPSGAPSLERKDGRAGGAGGVRGGSGRGPRLPRRTATPHVLTHFKYPARGNRIKLHFWAKAKQNAHPLL